MNQRRPAPQGEELLAHGRFLRSLARGLVSDAERVDELVQDTWATALEHPPRHGSALKAWLAKILRNTAIKRGQREGERPAREQESERRTDAREHADDPAALSAEIELQRHVYECLQRLRDPYQSTLYLRYYRGLAPQVIAAEQRVPVKTVKTRLARGLELMREDLDRRNGGREAWVALLLPMARLAPPLPLEPAAAPAGASAPVLAAGLVGGALLLAGAVVVAFYATGSDARRPTSAIPADTSAASTSREREPAGETRSGLADGRQALPLTSEEKPPAPGARLFGRVVDEAGEPLAAVELELRALAQESRGGRARFEERFDLAGARGGPGPRETDETEIHALTDEHGEFALTWPRTGLLRLGIERDGFAPLGRRLLVFAGQELDLGALVLPVGVSLAGRVVDENGSPLPAAEIWQERADEGLTFQSDEQVAFLVGRTDARGQFALERVAAGGWSLEARAAGRVPAALSGSTTRAGERVGGLELVAARGSAIRGLARGLAPGELARASVIARSSRSGTSAGRDWTRVALDPAGAFELDGLAADERLELVLVLERTDDRPRELSDPVQATAGDENVELFARGGAERSAPHRALDGAPPVEASAAGSAAVEVVVRRADGTSASGALVAHRSDTAARRFPFDGAIRGTDADGRVAWDGLAPGRHEFRLVSAVFGAEARSAEEDWHPVTVGEGGRERLELQAAPRAALGGHARRAGVPLVGAEILLRPASEAGPRFRGGFALRARCDAQGRFSFGELPLGTYRAELCEPTRPLPERREIELGAQGAELLFELGDAHLTGIIVDRDGRPVVAARVAAQVTNESGDGFGEPFEAEPSSEAGVACDAAGRFDLGGLEPGRELALVVRAPGFAVRRLGPLRPEAFQRIELAPEARLLIERGPDAPPSQLLLARSSAGETHAFRLERAASQEIHGLAPGSWTLELRARAMRGSRGEEGDARTVELSSERETKLRW